MDHLFCEYWHFQITHTEPGKLAAMALQNYSGSTIPEGHLCIKHTLKLHFCHHSTPITTHFYRLRFQTDRQIQVKLNVSHSLERQHQLGCMPLLAQHLFTPLYTLPQDLPGYTRAMWGQVIITGINTSNISDAHTGTEHWRKSTWWVPPMASYKPGLFSLLCCLLSSNTLPDYNLVGSMLGVGLPRTTLLA